MPRTVLIADDDRLTRLMLRVELEAQGYRVVDEAADGYGAIALAAAIEPDFVILDQMMPLLDGTDALAAIRSVSPTSRIIVHSSIDSADFAAQALADGAAGCVSKQQDLDHLVSLLADLSR
jgi:two-component system response regulator EvgA